MMNNTDLARLMDWWRMAGVDFLPGDEAESWLAVRRANGTGTASPIADPIPVLAEPTVSAPLLPDTVEAFSAWMTGVADLPVSIPVRGRIAARGPLQPTLMVMIDMPEEGDAEAGRLLNGPFGRLLTAMTRAIGLDDEAVMVASLSPARTASGSIDAAAGPRLAQLAGHLVSLVQPGHVLVLGDAASRALTGMGVVEARQGLQKFNHRGGTVATTVTFHPRLLLQKPVIKAHVWQDLQSLRRHLGQ